MRRNGRKEGMEGKKTSLGEKKETSELGVKDPGGNTAPYWVPKINRNTM